MQTPEEFVRELAGLARVDKPWGYGEHDEHGPIAAVEADRAAVALAAKRELLDELQYAMRCRQSGKGAWIGPLDALALAVDDILDKNGRKLWGLSKIGRWVIPDSYSAKGIGG